MNEKCFDGEKYWYSEYAEFDRFDICEAYAVFEWGWHVGGWLRERKSNQRRLMATSVQLSRMQFKPHWDLCFETLSENGKAIYRNLEIRYGLLDQVVYEAENV